MSESTVSIRYFSDILCVWAYVAEIRLEELRHHFAGRIEVESSFVPIFGSANALAERWANRGGLEAYAAHVQQVADGFDHIELHPGVWSELVPAGSLGIHAFCKGAASLAAEGAFELKRDEANGGRHALEELAWQLRLAFFRDLRDVARLDVQLDISRSIGLPADEIRARIEDGSALAALAEDLDDAKRLQISGSPTFLLNEGRQKLYGNVGYRIIEANIQELLNDNRDMSSWC